MFHKNEFGAKNISFLSLTFFIQLIKVWIKSGFVFRHVNFKQNCIFWNICNGFFDFSDFFDLQNYSHSSHFVIESQIEKKSFKKYK